MSRQEYHGIAPTGPDVTGRRRDALLDCPSSRERHARANDATRGSAVKLARGAPGPRAPARHDPPPAGPGPRARRLRRLRRDRPRWRWWPPKPPTSACRAPPAVPWWRERCRCAPSCGPSSGSAPCSWRRPLARLALLPRAHARCSSTSAAPGWAEILGVAFVPGAAAGAEAAVILALRLAGLALVAATLQRGGAALGCAWALAALDAPALRASPPSRGAARTAEPRASTAAPDRGGGAILRTSLPLAVNGGLALLSLRVELLVMSALRGSRRGRLLPGRAPGRAGPQLRPQRALRGRHARPDAGGARAPLASGGARRGAGAAPRPRWPSPPSPRPSASPWWLPRSRWPSTGMPTGPRAAPLAVLALGVVPLFLNGVFTHALIAADQARAGFPA